MCRLKRLKRQFYLDSFSPAHTHQRHRHRSRGGEGRGGPEFRAGDCAPQILSCCKIFRTADPLALQCRKMCFLPLQQDFYSKSRHASPQYSSQIYAYDQRPCGSVASLRNASVVPHYVMPHNGMMRHPPRSTRPRTLAWPYPVTVWKINCNNISNI